MLVPLHHGLDLDESFGVLKISRRWFSSMYVATLVFSLLWNAVLVVVYSRLMQPGFAEQGFPNGRAVLFPLGHVAVGLGLAYFSIAGLLNRTTFVVGQGNLRVSHHPVPWPGNGIIPEASIKQLYVSERTRASNSGGYTVYSVHVVLTEGKQVKLVTNLPDKQQALFLESRIEQYLRIRDEAVMGEVKKD